MPMNYCNTCQTTENSTNWDSNRCLKCGNPFNAMALTTSANRNTTALTTIANSASSDLKSWVGEVNQSGVNATANYTDTKGNLNSGNYRCETMNYNPYSGDYHYRKVEFKKN